MYIKLILDNNNFIKLLFSFRKNGGVMSNLNQIELQNLKSLIEYNETSYKKLEEYASQASDPQIKQIFKKSAQEALNTKQKLVSFFE